MSATLSILGLFQYDDTIFDNLVLPDNVDAEILRDNLLAELAELETLYTNPDFMKLMIGAWSKKMLPTWNKLYAALTATYNPIENYDRQETSDSTVNSGGTRTDSGTDSDTEQVSAFDASTFQNRAKTNRDYGHQVSDSLSGATHVSGRVHGNIGVTTSQQMIEAEIELRNKGNIYDYIIHDFKMRFCVLVY